MSVSQLIRVALAHRLSQVADLLSLPDAAKFQTIWSHLAPRMSAHVEAVARREAQLLIARRALKPVG